MAVPNRPTTTRSAQLTRGHPVVNLPGNVSVNKIDTAAETPSPHPSTSKALPREPGLSRAGNLLLAHSNATAIIAPAPPASTAEVRAWTVTSRPATSSTSGPRTKATTPSATANIWKTSNTRKAKRIRRRRALPKANNNTAVKRLGATGKLITSKTRSTMFGRPS